MSETAGVPWSPLPTSDGSGPPVRPLREGLDRVLAGLGSPPTDALIALRERWADLVGPEAAAALVPVAVERGRVVAVTASAAWASQARWLEADLVRRAAALVGPGVVEGLVVRVRRPPG